MSVSQVSICNRALTELKAERITSLTEESEEARICSLYYDEALDSLLEMHIWDFAMARATLALSSTTPDYEYEYYYQLPTTPYCIRVVSCVDSSGYDVDDWKVEGRYIATDTEDIKIRYIMRIDNIVNTSPTFREALVFWLAHKMAYGLTGSASMEQLMLSKFRAMYRKAIVQDAKQGAPYQEKDDDYDWIEARFT